MDEYPPEVYERAHELQSVGPDEYPTGYYLWLAEKQLSEEKQ